MKSVKSIVYRNLTDADFFNIYKPQGVEDRGGGQSYIDFPIASISLENWDNFFENIINLRVERKTQGNSWTFPVHSMCFNHATRAQSLKIYQRRQASVSIASQKIYSSRSNRVFAWQPENGFPEPIDNLNREQCPEGLIIYLVSLYDGTVWAGWFLNDGTSPNPCSSNSVEDALEPMLQSSGERNGNSGYLEFEIDTLFLDTANGKFVLNIPINENPVEQNLINNELNEQEEVVESDSLFDSDLISNNNFTPVVQQRVVNIRQRNKKIVSKLKSLYRNTCQITGDEFIFKKKNGEGYTEAHHLIPLGENGDDSVRNLIILCPQMHRMLHYADVSPINLNDIVIDADGSARLEIEINSKKYIIKWHSLHARVFDENI